MRHLAAFLVLLAVAQPMWTGLSEGVAAAEQDDARAQNNPCENSLKSQGVPSDHVEAVKWYRKAAERGNALAQVILGVMYDRGEGVPQDYAEAMKWYLMAADQGHVIAQNNIAVMFERGRGVQQDYVQALKWYKIAVAQALASQNASYYGAFKNLENLAANKMTPAQIAEAQKLAREWLAAFEKRGGK